MPNCFRNQGFLGSLASKQQTLPNFLDFLLPYFGCNITISFIKISTFSNFNSFPLKKLSKSPLLGLINCVCTRHCKDYFQQQKVFFRFIFFIPNFCYHTIHFFVIINVVNEFIIISFKIIQNASAISSFGSLHFSIFLFSFFHLLNYLPYNHRLYLL